jgi:DNA-binding XRE family transcriptional regulator
VCLAHEIHCNVFVIVSQTKVLDSITRGRYGYVMVEETMTEDTVDRLLEEVRSRLGLPPAKERRRIRERAGVSLRQAGAAVGVSWMAIVRWEEGSQPRNPEHAVAYGRLLEELRHLA